MHKLFRSLSRDRNESGVALPYVFNSFRDNGIKFYPGDFVMIAGPPGAGKSALALNYALRCETEHLYISSDMASSLVIKRSLSIKTGEDPDLIEEEMQTSEGLFKYSKVLQSIDHMYMDYPSRPDAEAVAKSIMSTMEILGVPPPILTVDNLMNLDSGKENEWAGMRELAQVLKFIAKELEIVVFALHHTHTGVADLSSPVPYSHIMGKIAELPATILTIAKRPGQMLFSPVKNRHGKADATANIVVPLDYDEKRQIITDPIPKEVIVPQYRQVQYQTASASDWRERAYKD